MTAATLLIAIGNPLRRDDGTGPEILRRLRSLDLPNLEYRQESGEGASLMDCWRDRRRVYVFDAVRANGGPGTVHRLDATETRIPSDFFRYSTHAFSLAEAVEMARALGELPGSLVIYGIEGADFASGEGLSPPVARAVDEVVARVQAELR